MKLYKRPDKRSANWYVRLIILSALQSVFDADRFIKSTKSSDKVLARARAAEIVAVWERKLYDQAMTLRDSGRFEEREPRPAVISKDLIELLCTSRIGSHMQTDDAERVVGLTCSKNSRSTVSRARQPWRVCAKLPSRGILTL